MKREYINSTSCQLTSLAVSIVIPIIFLKLYIMQKPMASIFLVMNYRFSKNLPDYAQNRYGAVIFYSPMLYTMKAFSKFQSL